MAEKAEIFFWSSSICLICEKLIDNEKVRDHSYITEKYRGAAHWSCNVNLKLTIKVFTIFHKLKGYDSHLIMNEIGRFSEKEITWQKTFLQVFNP